MRQRQGGSKMDRSLVPPCEQTGKLKSIDETSVVYRLFYLCGGMLLAIGLYVSTMVLPQSIYGFMCLQGLWNDPFSWNPSLLFVFACALGSHMVLYNVFIRPDEKCPLIAEKFDIPTNKTIDLKLVLGAFLFGCGWGFTGLCPGPAIVAVGRLDFSAALYLTFVILSAYGWLIFDNHVDSISHLIPSFFYLCLYLLFIWVPQILLLFDISSTNQVKVETFDREKIWYLPVVGGLVIGMTIFLFMLAVGKIAGNSGMLKGNLHPNASERVNRFLWFLAMVFTGFWMSWALPFPASYSRPWWLYVISGCLTGIGTTISNGCTSGHGICGVSRFSIRSVVATAVFFSTCIAAATLIRLATEDTWQWEPEDN